MLCNAGKAQGAALGFSQQSGSNRGGAMLNKYRAMWYKWRSRLNFALWPSRIVGYIRRMLGI